MTPFISLVLALAQPPAAKPADPFAKWEPEIAAIEKRLKENPPKPLGVVFAGSSSIRLWDVKKSFPELAAVNVGFGGSTIPDSTHFAGRVILPCNPWAIVFYAGDNDINAGRTPERVRDDFKAFCETVQKASPRTQIFFVAVKPSLARWPQFEAQTKANQLVRDYCKAGKGLKYVDIVAPMLGADGKPKPELFVKDGLHLSPAGYDLWTGLVRKALVE
jgi:lysophospholipase L1-like esterase